MSVDPMSGEFLERIQKLSPKRLALLAAELERRLAGRDAVACEPVAVIGLGCRTPGGVDSPTALWKLLAEGVDAIEVVPPNRWDADAFYDPRPETPGKANTKWGGFVSGIDQFDPAFFGISPREAIGMDPQQRMLLEVSWEALENACVRAESLNGSPTGVFAGVSTNDYAILLDQYDKASLDAYYGTGAARSIATGRLSYFLGLKGPNLSIDTSCSSSAVAIHLACQSLRQSECRMALAGGVNAILVPQLTVTLSQARMLSGDGRCKTFSESADGFVRSEGCGMLVLKRLADARADGDRILGLIRGSAINHDGRSSGLTAPSGPSQEEVIKAALRQAGLRPDDVDYLEAHGTGTVLGDAIELGALGAVFSASRSPNQSHGAELTIGSVKTNIGHLEAAAGVAGVIKVLLGLQYEFIPPHLHVSEGKENNALQGLPLKIAKCPTPWPVSARPRIAGVSSFGFSGTNAHIVIEEASSAYLETSWPAMAEVITLSAKSVEALKALCGRHAEYLRDHAYTSLADFAFSLNTGRSHFQHRVALLATSTREVATELQQIADNDVKDHSAYRFVASYAEPAIGFLFTGQGSQYAGMGSVLYTQSSVFRSAVDRCDAILSGKLAHRLSQVLCGNEAVPEDLIHDTAWTQPALFVLEYALAMLWRSWGARPSVVLGHSLGEYVAACIAGVFSLEAALTIAFERGRLMGSLPRSGGMLAVLAGEVEIAEMIRPLTGLSIAAVNGERNVVVSGVSEQIEKLRVLLAERNLVSQPLQVSHAFHSASMEPILDEFERRTAEFRCAAPEVQLISNVTGKVLSPSDRIDASYWRRHIRGAVRFSDGLSSLMAQNPAALLEIGPDPVLLGMAKPALSRSSIPSIASLRRGKDPWHSLYEAVRQLYLLGGAINWDMVYRDRPGRKLALPTYPFQRQRYWVTLPESASPPPSPRMSFDPLLYATEWRVLPSSDNTFQPPTPEYLIDAATKAIDAMHSDGETLKTLAAYGDFLPEIDLLCTTYILETLEELGVQLHEGARLSLVDLPSKFGVKPEHRRLMQRLFAILEEDRIVHYDGDAWVFGRIPSGKSVSDHALLLTKFPSFAAELNFLAQTSNLARVLRGQMSAVAALFPDGSLKLAEDLYQQAPAARMFNRALGEVVRRSVEAYSADQVVRVLEVGAGTGSATSEILPLLKKERVEYIFTDVSPAFFGLARSKFAKFPFVRYGTLDLEKEIGGDLGIGGGVDIIVAANVLHATADLAQTLNRLRSTLRPGGTILISECTVPQRFGDLTVGMTEGWSRYTDAPRRQSYPLISRREWLDLFSELGLCGAALPEDGRFRFLTERQSLLAAQPSGTAPRKNAPSALVLRVGTDPDLLSPALKGAGIVVHKLEDAAVREGERGTALQSSLKQRLLAEMNLSSIMLELGDTTVSSEVPDLTLDNAVAVLELLQAVSVAGSDRSTIWLVTKGAAAIENEGAVNLPSVIADAMARTARIEHPELSIRWVDLPLKPAERDWLRLDQLIREGSREPSIAIRQGKLIVPRLVPLSTVVSGDVKPCRFSPDAAYLVTGAYGGLGFRTARWMAERGARCIFMVGRREPSNEIREQILKLNNGAVRIHALVADISERRDVEKIFEQIAESGAELRGVVHAAGTLDDGTLLQQTREKFAKVFAPRVKGSWLLDEFSRKYSLDFFVLFGSAASVLESGGLSNYAAANGFLNALSRQRQREGLPSTTIAWGPWSEIGITTYLKDTGRAARLGLSTFSPEKGIELLEQAISSGLPEVATLPVDWRVFLRQVPVGNAAFFEEVTPPPSDDPPSSTRPDQLKSLLETTPAENRLSVIKQHVRARIIDVLRLASAFRLRDDQPLPELGLDSLMALELKNGLQKDLGVTLTPNFFFEYPTLDLAAMYLNARLVGASDGARTQPDSSEYEELAI
jgi:acyl transferase domain-containing protein/NAD(P)-dependent dehydrogenase (short-subunit alcohol dehydrogenase family)/SAM-dependent methyltransferase/acyl carrier protein